MTKERAHRATPRPAGETEVARVPKDASGSLVIVGNFDGVHRGHQAILQRGVQRARERGLRPMALTFHPHPAEVLGRGVQPVLTPVDRKLQLIGRLAPELVALVEPFTQALSELSPERFVRELLLDNLGAREVVVGENFRFGRGRAGNADTLAELGEQLAFQARAEALREDGGAIISSTRIRELLGAGDVQESELLLGRPHSVSGRVARGRGQARDLGVPSANLASVQELLPATGIYAVLVDEQREGHFRCLGKGVANVGTRPTLERGGHLLCEVHLLDFEGDLYGRRLRAHFVRRLRDEVRFDSEAALRARLDQDKVDAAHALASRAEDPAAGGAWH